MRNSNTIQRLLVANRGEIALRVMRTCREMGILSIAAYGDGEEYAPHVRYADEAIRIPSTESRIPYLDIDALISSGLRMHADAIHPGYGFLSEHAGFAEAVQESGMILVGPPSKAIATMGDKIAARKIADHAGVPTVPGTLEPIETIAMAERAAQDIGYPVAVKAAGGGGGRGFRIARTRSDLPAAYEGATGEAARYFRNPSVYLERYLDRPRHIEVQILADIHGNIVAIGERDCSIQRRHQKLIEETPAPGITSNLRSRMSDAACALARAVDYIGAGTVEFLVDTDMNFFFLEMNTRIQVEHTITEMVTGIDLVREQIAIASGEALSFDAANLRARGVSIECRINAEDAGRDFLPAAGTIAAYREPTGLGVRVDSAVLAVGDAIHPSYDSLAAKVVTWGRDRNEALDRMLRSLDDFKIGNMPTTIPFHRNVIASNAYRSGPVTTAFLTDHPELLPEPQAPANAQTIAEPPERVSFLVEVNGRRFETVVQGDGISTRRPPTQKRRLSHSASSDSVLSDRQDDLLSPLHGSVIRVEVSDGSTVRTGDVIAVIEAMKMENELVAHKSGIIHGLNLVVGATVSIGQQIATIISDPSVSG